MTTTFEKYNLLLWKNYKTRSRHILQTIIEVLFPVLFIVCLAFLRGFRKIPYENLRQYESFVPGCNLNEPVAGYANYSKLIAFSPRNNSNVRILVKTVQTHFELKGFEFDLVERDDAADLDEFLEVKNPFVGIEFSDELKDSEELPKKLEYSLRLREIDFNNNFRTDTIQSVNRFTKVPRSTLTDGGVPYYNRRCFLTIQNKIDRSFIKLVSNMSLSFTKTTLNKFPTPLYKNDLYQILLPIALPTFIVFSFIYIVKNMIKNVGLEKDNQLKEFMRIAGMSRYLQWSAWFTKYFVFLFIIISIMTVVLCKPFFSIHGPAIFPKSNMIVIWIFLMLYILPTIGFCFFMSTLFKKASLSANIGDTVWTIMVVPFFYTMNFFYQLSYPVKMLLCLFPNIGLGYGLSFIFKLEVIDIGLQFENLFCRVNEDKFSVGDVLICFVLSAVLLMILTLYFERVFPGTYGVPRPWHFPISDLLYKRIDSKKGSTEETNRFLENFEEEPRDKLTGIKINGLTKSFDGKKNVVDHLNLNIYKDQITVLLGHNGSGKTTTMSMLTGLFPPTSGTCIIDGKDIEYDMKKIRESIGLCPQFDVLFDDLTVEEHLIFYSYLKGISKHYVYDEAHKYIELLGLESKKNSLSKTLSGGMKRRLSVAIALCGNSKIVILDEPTSGMDTAVRRRLWDLLIEEKIGRTILLTTHFMDEADVLGDRIAVMVEGELKTVGSSFFLKKKFGVGYRLIIVKDELCSSEQITELLKTYIPEIDVQTDVGTELTYVLNESYVHVFPSIFQEIEMKSGRLGILSFGVSLTTMEEVFLKVGLETHEFLDKQENGDDVFSGLEDDTTDSLTELKPTGHITGASLILSQILAMMLKKLCYMRWEYKVILYNMFFTIFYVIFILSTISGSKLADSPPLKISLDSYPEPVIILQLDHPSPFHNTTNVFGDWIKHDVPQKTEILYISHRDDMGVFILRQYPKSYERVNKDYIFGTTFNKSVPEITGWFNDEAPHAAPLALNFVNRALVKEYAGQEYDISVTNKPFQYKKFESLDDDDDGDGKDDDDSHVIIEDFIIMLLFGILYSIWTAVFIGFYIKEKTNKVKLLQLISGINKFVFWIVPFIIDYVLLLFVTLLMIVTTYCFKPHNFNELCELIALFLICAAFCFAILPLVYLLSLLFKKPTTGQSFVSVLSLFVGCFLFIIYSQMISSPDGIVKKIVSVLYWVLIIFPQFTLMDTMNKFHEMNLEVMSLESKCRLLGLQNCAHINPCKGDYFDSFDCSAYFEKRNSVIRNSIIMVGLGFLYLLILLLKEYHVFSPIIRKCERKRKMPPLDEEYDSDVQEEAIKVNALSKNDLVDFNMLLNNLTKYYKNHLVVKRISALVEDSMCFGLLGANGAGKTTVFKMLTGDEKISAGQAFIKSFNVSHEMNKIHNLIGYCPQFDALLEELTGRQTLRIFALIKGIPRSQVSDTVKILADKLRLTKYMDKRVKTYSGGTKRKLSTAISLVGDPEVLLLDEPTSGMDPEAKRRVWNVIIEARSHGKSVILTSHSMEECEALCTKIAIMVDGRFKCLGSTQHLKNKFSSGFLLTIKAGKHKSVEHILEIKEFVNRYFPEADLKEEYMDILTYQIPRTNLKWSEMFKLMEEISDEHNIDDYSLGQTSLEQVFLHLTKDTLYSKKEN